MCARLWRVGAWTVAHMGCVRTSWVISVDWLAPEQLNHAPTGGGAGAAAAIPTAGASARSQVRVGKM